jgi:RNA polymerase sigma-70 factor, ECF subfamily
MDEMHATRAERLRPDGHDDHGWFDALYPHLHRVACVAAPADVDPDDLVQDALVNLLSLSESADVRDRRAYLIASIVNLATNHRRSWSRRRAAVARLHVADGQRDELPSDLADLLALPARERAVLYLHHVEGHPYDEVARVVGCTPAAARKSAERGRARLADTLASEEDDR